MKTLILGLGNDILGDDAVGLEVANSIKKMNLNNVDVKTLISSGLDILDIISGYNKVIIVDAIITKTNKIGTIHRLIPEDFHKIQKISYSIHNTNISTIFEIGKKLNMMLPKEIIFYGIEIKDRLRFKEGLSKKIKNTLPLVLNRIIAEIESS